MLYVSTDGGRSWTRRAPLPIASGELAAIDGRTAVLPVYRDTGTLIVVTHDGGARGERASAGPQPSADEAAVPLDHRLVLVRGEQRRHRRDEQLVELRRGEVLERDLVDVASCFAQNSSYSATCRNASASLRYSSSFSSYDRSSRSPIAK
jgi:hypothetical protein